MVRLLILQGDEVRQTIDLKDNFLFVLVKNGKEKCVMHMDSTDGKLWTALKGLSNLNHNKNKKGHDYIVRKNLKEMK